MQEIWHRTALETVDRLFDAPDELGYDKDVTVRSLEIELVDPDLTPEQKDLIRNLAEWRLPFPYLPEASAGRTLFAALKRPLITTSGREIRGFKFKGAGGLAPANNGRVACRQPQPHEAYGTKQFHVKVQPDLTLETVISTRKALHSLTLAAANTEYRMQERLAEHDLGFRPLLTGRFLEDSGETERDCLDRETGVVVSEYDPECVRVEALSDFSFTDGMLNGSEALGQYMKSIAFLAQLRNTEGNIVKALRLNFLDFIKRMASCKKRTALAGIARHAADTGNFFINKHTRQMYVSDTDSCILYDPLEGEARGAQLLRDTASDLFKITTRFTFSAYSEDFIEHLEEYNPFFYFLRGFFVDVETGPLMEASKSLCESLRRFLREHQSDIEHIAALRGTATSGTERKFLLTQWTGILYPLLAHCLTAVYKILIMSQLQDSFPVKRIDPSVFSQQAETFINEDFLRALWAYNETLASSSSQNTHP